MICTQCQKPADVQASFVTSQGPTQCLLCKPCLGVLWTKFAHTQFGQTLSIVPVGRLQEPPYE